MLNDEIKKPWPIIRLGSLKTTKATYLNGWSYCLNYTVENASPFHFKWPPVKKTFVYDTSSNGSSPKKTQILWYALDKQLLVLLKIDSRFVINYSKGGVKTKITEHATSHLPAAFHWEIFAVFPRTQAHVHLIWQESYPEAYIKQ